MPGVLHKQHYGRGEDMLPSLREGRLSISHSGQETTSILPSAHHLCSNAVPSASHVSNVRLHWLDFQVGSKDWRFERKILAENSHKGADPS